MSTHRIRSITGTLAAVAVAASALAACAPAGPALPDEPTPFSLQLRFTPSVQFAASYAADDLGYYEDSMLDVELLPGGAGISGEPLLMQGQIDVAQGAPANIGNANAEGATLTIIAAGYQSTAGALISLADDPVETPEDLIGMRVGVASGNTVVNRFLAANGIDESQVTIVPIQGDASPLISDQVDVMYGLITNQVLSLETQGYEPVVMRVSDWNMNNMDMTYSVNSASLEDEAARDSLVRFLMAEIRGWQKIVEDPAYAADITVNDYAQEIGLNPDQQLAQAQASVQLIQPTPDTQILSMSDELIATTIETMSAQGVEMTPEMFDTSLLAEAYERLAAE